MLLKIQRVWLHEVWSLRSELSDWTESFSNTCRRVKIAWYIAPSEFHRTTKFASWSGDGGLVCESLQVIIIISYKCTRQRFDGEWHEQKSFIGWLPEGILRESGNVMQTTKFWSEEILIATIPWQQSLDAISHVFYAVEKAFCICILQQADRTLWMRYCWSELTHFRFRFFSLVPQRYYLVTSETCYTETLLGHIWHAHVFIIVE